MSVEFAQIQIEPAYRKVAAAIGERILSRTLREGERLPSETELARQFGVNRSTVREALRELESRGLVQRRPGSKLMSVARPEPEEVGAGISHALVLNDATVRDVWEALTILEPPIAVAAAGARTAADLEALREANALLAEGSPDTAVAVRRTADAFRGIGRATHNPVLGLAQEPLLRLLEPSLRIMIDKVPQARTRIVEAQRQLLQAIAAADRAAAQTWMARHIRDFGRGYELAGIDLSLKVHA
ncbi:MAG TPA: GntR family transcriptional regulator [Steroidobacteraceae bacterium]|nr:GntR family transcriptional regulator [Steroidobacteraceae bacterium]